MPVGEVPYVGEELLHKAAQVASGELQTRFSVVLKTLGLDDEHGHLAAAGALCVGDMVTWATSHGMMSVPTAVAVQSIIAEVVAALQALAESAA